LPRHFDGARAFPFAPRLCVRFASPGITDERRDSFPSDERNFSRAPQVKDVLHLFVRIQGEFPMSGAANESELPAEQDVRPCKHMEGMVNSLADGTLHGPARWYTELHSLHCTQCRAAVKNLRTVIATVKELGGDAEHRAPMPGARRADIERAMDEVDVAARNKA
jgi:hypothetical protein